MGHTHGRKWSEEEIAKEIYKVKEALNIDRMPSNSEIQLVTKDTSLSNAISKRGGFVNWSKKLNLKIKNSETSLGRDYEQIVADVLKNKGYEVERMSTRHPYDLLVNNNIKIDVKVSNLYKGPKGDFYTFNLEKHNHNCDLFICVCIEKKVKKILVIPSKMLMKVNQLSIGNKSIYDIYIDRFDYIEKFDLFYRDLN